jgi:hypothetical protein
MVKTVCDCLTSSLIEAGNDFEAVMSLAPVMGCRNGKNRLDVGSALIIQPATDIDTRVTLYLANRRYIASFDLPTMGEAAI